MGVRVKGCWAAGFLGGTCDGRLDKHHVGFKQQTLRKMGFSEDVIWDDRIVFPVCRAHHARIHSAHFHLWKHQLPPSVIAFATEHDLLHLIEKQDRKRSQTDPRSQEAP